jgi:hypothetical protein
MGIQKQQCSVATHAASINFEQACDGTEVIYFQDLTDNHNKALIQVQRSGITPENCQMELVINGTTSFIVPSFTGGGGAFAGQVSVQVEDVRTVGIRCTCITGTCAYCAGLISIQKTFCICCP